MPNDECGVSNRLNIPTSDFGLSSLAFLRRNGSAASDDQYLTPALSSFEAEREELRVALSVSVADEAIQSMESMRQVARFAGHSW